MLTALRTGFFKLSQSGPPYVFWPIEWADTLIGAKECLLGGEMRDLRVANGLEVDSNKNALIKPECFGSLVPHTFGTQAKHEHIRSGLVLNKDYKVVSAAQFILIHTWLATDGQSISESYGWKLRNWMPPLIMRRMKDIYSPAGAVASLDLSEASNLVRQAVEGQSALPTLAANLVGCPPHHTSLGDPWHALLTITSLGATWQVLVAKPPAPAAMAPLTARAAMSAATKASAPRPLGGKSPAGSASSSAIALDIAGKSPAGSASSSAIALDPPPSRPGRLENGTRIELDPKSIELDSDDSDDELPIAAMSAKVSAAAATAFAAPAAVAPTAATAVQDAAAVAVTSRSSAAPPRGSADTAKAASAKSLSISPQASAGAASSIAGVPACRTAAPSASEGSVRKRPAPAETPNQPKTMWAKPVTLASTASPAAPPAADNSVLQRTTLLEAATKRQATQLGAATPPKPAQPASDEAREPTGRAEGPRCKWQLLELDGSRLAHPTKRAATLYKAGAAATAEAARVSAFYDDPAVVAQHIADGLLPPVAMDDREHKASRPSEGDRFVAYVQAVPQIGRATVMYKTVADGGEAAAKKALDKMFRNPRLEQLRDGAQASEQFVLQRPADVPTPLVHKAESFAQYVQETLHPHAEPGSDAALIASLRRELAAKQSELAAKQSALASMQRAEEVSCGWRQLAIEKHVDDRTALYRSLHKKATNKVLTWSLRREHLAADVLWQMQQLAPGFMMCVL